MFFMDLFGKMELNSYLCRAKKETLRIIPQQFLVRQHDTVQLTYPAKQSTTFWLIVPASPHSTMLIAVISADCGEDADTWRTIVSPRSVVICTSNNSI